MYISVNRSIEVIHFKMDLKLAFALLLFTASLTCTLGQEERYLDCQDVYDSGQTTNGVYSIWPLTSTKAFQVYCEMNNGNGWTIIQRRLDGEENFKRPYSDYLDGFGDVNWEYWLGNENIFELTNGNDREYQLRVDLNDWVANSVHAIYSGFRVEDSFNRYRLWLTSFDGGPAGDSMSINNGTQFSTFDQDNDGVINADYGNRYSGGWWYSMWFSDGHTANLNGHFYDNGDYTSDYADGIHWKSWSGHWYSHRTATMKILPTGPAATKSTIAQTINYENNSGVIIAETTLTDCQDAVDAGYTETGVYEIYPEGLPYGTPVWCEIDDQMGWTVFQRRMDGSQDFHLYWEDYKRGFGNINGEFWLGNEAIHLITTSTGSTYELHVDLQTEDTGEWFYVKYADFKITNEGDNYRLTYDHFIEGTANDDLDYHKNNQFTTRDRDNDLWVEGNCGDNGYGGAWWYNKCWGCVLNGYYTDRVVWSTDGGAYHVTTFMKIRLI